MKKDEVTSKHIKWLSLTDDKAIEDNFLILNWPQFFKMTNSILDEDPVKWAVGALVELYTGTGLAENTLALGVKLLKLLRKLVPVEEFYSGIYSIYLRFF